jgi:hypothetical protein
MAYQFPNEPPRQACSSGTTTANPGKLCANLGSQLTARLVCTRPDGTPAAHGSECPHPAAGNIHPSTYAGGAWTPTRDPLAVTDDYLTYYLHEWDGAATTIVGPGISCYYCTDVQPAPQQPTPTGFHGIAVPHGGSVQPPTVDSPKCLVGLTKDPRSNSLACEAVDAAACEALGPDGCGSNANCVVWTKPGTTQTFCIAVNQDACAGLPYQGACFDAPYWYDDKTFENAVTGKTETCQQARTACETCVPQSRDAPACV